MNNRIKQNKRTVKTGENAEQAFADFISKTYRVIDAIIFEVLG